MFSFFLRFLFCFFNLFCAIFIGLFFNQKQLPKIGSTGCLALRI